MASSGKRRTTMTKLNREGRLRDKRVEKQARKAARKLAAARDAASPPEHLGSASTERDRLEPGDAAMPGSADLPPDGAQGPA